MKQLKLNKKYTPEKLIDFGFKKYGISYKMFVPLYENNDEKLIEAEVLISPTDSYIGYDVLDVCNKTLYYAFYNQNCLCNYSSDVLKTVIKNINNLFENLEKKEIIINN